MNALREMVRLRGGIETLDSNRIIRVSLHWYVYRMPSGSLVLTVVLTSY
jgi:hypothetical protein